MNYKILIIIIIILAILLYLFKNKNKNKIENFELQIQKTNLIELSTKYNEGISLISVKNPTTNKVLKMLGNSSFYKLPITISPNKIYKISCYQLKSKTFKNKDNLFNIVSKTDNYNIIASCDGTIKSTKNDWNYIEYYFKTSTNVNDSNLYIGYYPQTQGYRYIVDLKMNEVLINDTKYPVLTDLYVYLKNENKIQTTWKDYSNNNNNFTWLYKPSVDKNNGYIINNNVLSNNTVKLSNSFTIILSCSIKPNTETSISNALEFTNSSNTIIYNLSNNKSTNINISVNKKIYNLGKPVINIQNLNYYIFNYQNGKLTFQINNNIINTIDIPDLSFTGGDTYINANKNLQGTIKDFIIYNNSISSTSITQILKYLKSDIENKKDYITNITKCNNLNSTNKFSQDFSGKGSINKPENYKNNNIYHNLSEQDLLNKCINDDKACDYYDKMYSDNTCKKQSYCPKVYYNNGLYYVYLPKNSYWAKKYRYYGAKSYGKNIDNARKVYQVNFPQCLVPRILRKEDYNGNLNECPFKVHENNPCNDFSCKNVNWNSKDPINDKYPDNCKLSINNYCSINYDKDDNCMCWNPEFKNTDKCIKYRKKFSPIDWNLFNINDFKIQDHKDFSKIVNNATNKCWGCSVNDPQLSNRSYKNK